MKRIVIAAVTLFLAAGASAQVPAPPNGGEGTYPGRPAVTCPHPITLDIQGEKSAPTPDPADLPAGAVATGSVWNQTAVNKHFAHTFHFKKEGECCAWTKGTLTMEVKALEGGPAKSPTSANDAVSVYSNKVLVPPEVSPWINGVSTGNTTTLTWNIPVSVLNRGEVSIYVEDDTAVVWAHLHLEECCIR